MIRYLFFYRIICLELCYTVGCFQLAMAQLPYTQAIPYPYQIPTQTIYDIFSDKDGQIWLGTNKGLYRFNGKNAIPVPFQTTRQQDITYLKQDAAGRIWGMNFANQVFYLQNDTLRLFSLPELQLAGSWLQFELFGNTIWLATTSAIAVIDINTQQILFQHTFNDYLYDVKLHCASLFIWATKFCYQIDATTYQMTAQPVPFLEVGRWVSRGDALWLAHREGNRKALQVKPVWQQLPDLSLPDSVVIYHYKSTKDGKLWICTKQGGWLWDETTGQTHCLFPNQQVTGVIQDYQNNYWISTLDDGLWFCPSLSATMRVPIQELAVQKIDITCIFPAEVPNFYWIGTANGKVYYTRLDSPQQRKIYKNDAYRKEITALAYHKNTQQIISSAGIFSPNGKQLKPMGYPKNVTIWGNKVLSAHSGAAEWATITNKPQNQPLQLWGMCLDSVQTQKSGRAIYQIRHERAYAVAIDTNAQKYWVAYADNLYEYDLNGNFYIIQTPQQESITAASLCTDQHGNLYAASFNQGLLVIKNRQVIKQLGRYDLLKTNECRHVVNQNDTIWVGTTQSIGYLSPEMDCFTDILGNNGMLGLSYQHFAIQYPYLLIATGASILTLPIQSSGANLYDTLRLMPAKIVRQSNNVTLQVEALNYKNPASNRFYYRLIGIDDTWHTFNDITLLLNYSQLKAGNYALELYAMDMLSGVRSQVMKVNFSVPKKWWETSVFYSFLLLFTALIIGLSFYVWAKRYKKRQSLQEQLWISQLKAIRAQMNPHFLYNILNTAQGLVYSNRKTEAATLLGNFSDLIRKTLETSEQPYILLQEEIKNLALYLHLEKVRFEEADFSYEMNYQQVRTWLEKEIPSMLLQPFVENAIKHGLLHKKGTKRLSIELKEISEKELHIRIEDNGIGRQNAAQIRARQAKPSTGFATSAIQQRIELLNKIGNYAINCQIKDKIVQEQPQGTQVEIRIVHIK